MALQACAPEPIVPLPVCEDPFVLRRVEEIMGKRGQTLLLDIAPVGEISTAPVRGPDALPLAHCSVRGHTIGYDTNRYGTAPLYAPFTIDYTIEMRRNGLFVSVD